MVWSEDAQQAFKEVKIALCKKPVLCTPDFNKPFALPFASGIAFGAALSQSLTGISSEHIPTGICKGMKDSVPSLNENA